MACSIRSAGISNRLFDIFCLSVWIVHIRGGVHRTSALSEYSKVS